VIGAFFTDARKSPGQGEVEEYAFTYEAYGTL
jgi:hypothetical protein